MADWSKSFKSRKPEDGPRDTSHGAVQSDILVGQKESIRPAEFEMPKKLASPNIARSGTTNWFKPIINMRKKKEVEQDFLSQVPDSVI